MKKTIRLWILSAIFLALFIFWTIIVKFVDTQAIGPEGSVVGLATLNGEFHAFTGVHFTLYNLTDWLGVLPFVCVLFFAGIGLFQLIKRKSLFKVDADILVLGCYYVIVLILYFLFRNVVINYRPVLIEGVNEASYPSSHTLLAASVMPTVVFEANKRVKKELLRKAINYASCAFALFMVVGRLVSGVHWLTDILGGLFLATGLFFTFIATYTTVNGKKRPNEIPTQKRKRRTTRKKTRNLNLTKKKKNALQNFFARRFY